MVEIDFYITIWSLLKRNIQMIGKIKYYKQVEIILNLIKLGQMTILKSKIKSWDKETKGHTCSDPLLAPVCVKSECVKRKFGIISDKKIDWPLMTNLIKVDFKPDPEYYFTVENKKGESVPVHAKDVNKIKDQKELRGLIMAQADVFPPPIKAMDFHAMINALLDTVDTVQPAPGTRPIEILKKLLKEHINGPQATTHNSFLSGNVLKDKSMHTLFMMIFLIF
jgi:hypothetical protein